MNDYYVYVYVDPRNFEDFYYGKGKDGRKDAHDKDTQDSAKTQRIAAIKAEGLSPIVRVIARGLTEDQALLVEKTLLWKNGKNLSNQASGSFSEKFRPRDTMHLELEGFDYIGGLYYFNVGQGIHRNWADCKKFGFISAGRGERWRDAICAFQNGDLIAAYLKGKGFVGIGRITQAALPIRSVQFQGKPLSNHALSCLKMTDDIESDDLCEYVALVEWIRAVEPDHAKWQPKSSLYTTQLVRASLAHQKETIRYLEKQFDLDLQSLQAHRSTEE
jgi:hypothetical protein